MRSAEFTDIKQAAEYRKANGGWLAILGATNAWWFDARCYTPSSIMASAQCAGRSFELVCDNRYQDGML